eukprot:1158086-Pelagomonas_calceolata.AAC.16
MGLHRKSRSMHQHLTACAECEGEPSPSKKECQGKRCKQCQHIGQPSLPVMILEMERLGRHPGHTLDQTLHRPCLTHFCMHCAMN